MLKFVVLCAVLAAVTVTAHEKTTTLVCSDVNGKKLLGPDPDTVARMASCSDPNIWGEGEGKKNPACTMFCVNKAFNLLDENGLPSHGVYETWITDQWVGSEADKYVEMGRKHFAHCVTKFLPQIDKSDPTCKGASDFHACAWSIQPRLEC